MLEEGKPWKQTAQMCLAQESSQRFEQHEGRTNSGYGSDLRNPKIERVNSAGRELELRSRGWIFSSNIYERESF